MIRIFLNLLLAVLVLGICLQARPVAAQPVSGRILDGVQINERSGKIEVSVNFNFPVRYRSHFPDEAGRELRIQLQPISVSADDRDALFKRESLTPAKGNLANISEIIYEGDTSSNLFMTIYFKKQTKFSVKQGSDFRSLLILVEPQATSGTFAINLESSIKEIDLATVPVLDAFQGLKLYTTQSELDGQIWHRLRLGFFPTPVAAKQVLSSLLKNYPQAWVTKAPHSDLAAAEQSAMSPAEIQKSAKKDSEPAKKQATPMTPKKPLAVEKQKSLLKDGEKAMISGDYSRASLIYTRLMESADPAISQQALEYLGLARERGNQLAHAKAEYEKYLTLYPDGEAAERVKQRLAGVLTAQATPKQKLRKAKGAAAAEKWQSDIYGSFSQFYDRDESYTNNEDAVVNRSALSTDIDLTARFRSDAFDIRSSFSGGYEKDFLDDEDSDERISSLYVDALSHKLNLSTRIGRQSRSTGGVLGRFDGGLVSWQAMDKLGINLVAGYPVASSKDLEIDTSRPLYGISFDLGTFAERWDFNTFYITQKVDDIVDREAIGGEVRYFHPNYSFFSLVDYDISYDVLNTFLFNGNWSITKNTTLNVSTNYRQSPILTTSNALQGQAVSTIDALLLSFTEDEVRQLAQDRTATSRTYTFGLTHSISEKLQVSGDLTISEFTGTPTSGGVLGYEGTGNEYYYSLQFIGSSLIKEGDIAIIGLRYTDSSTSRTYSANINTRYPITRNLRINPRLLIDYRTVNDSSNELLKFRPLLRMEYRWKRHYNLEIEGGLEFSTDKTSDTTDDRRGYFLTIGYRIDF